MNKKKVSESPNPTPDNKGQTERMISIIEKRDYDEQEKKRRKRYST